MVCPKVRLRTMNVYFHPSHDMFHILDKHTCRREKCVLSTIRYRDSLLQSLFFPIGLEDWGIKI